MFAGAAREAVFSNPNVIRRVNADFVPVALKAALVNNPPGDAEGRLYREIGRSKIAPQGICVVNPAGKVLDWVLTFDDDDSVLAFLDHTLKRYAEHPDANQAVPAERYMRFPSQRLDDVQDTRAAQRVPDRHAEGQRCPATPPVPAGTLEVRLVGRALDQDGKPVTDTVRQEHYVEDRFTVPVQLQNRLAAVLADAGRQPVQLPEDLVRPFVTHAYLGVLDVQPISNPGRSKGELRRCQFSAAFDESQERMTRWKITGESETFNGAGMANAGPGDMHAVELTWHGFIEVQGNRVSRVILSAHGTEQLRFGTARGKVHNEVALLPGGRRIDLNCNVRYGLLAEPAALRQYNERPP